MLRVMPGLTDKSVSSTTKTLPKLLRTSTNGTNVLQSASQAMPNYLNVCLCPLSTIRAFGKFVLGYVGCCIAIFRTLTRSV